MATQQPSLSIVPPPRTLDEEINEMFQRNVLSTLYNFANNLSTARVLWRTHRDLVEAPIFPDFLREAYAYQDDDDPDNPHTDFGQPSLSAEEREDLMAEARKAVRENRLRGSSRAAQRRKSI
jgi:hypothetical protein